MEQDPPVLPVAWENINDIWYNYVKGHNPKDYFGIYDCRPLRHVLAGQVGELPPSALRGRKIESGYGPVFVYRTTPAGFH